MSIIKPVAEARPDSNQATFSMGLAALATGDAAVRAGAKPRQPEAKEHFDLAIRSFRGILVKEPDNLRVRLELARGLFSRGNCVEPPRNLFKHMLGDDCWAAEQHFLRLLGAKVPPQVVMNVQQFIQICCARKRASGTLSLALAPDTDVNTSTSAQTVDIFGLPFQLDDAARAKSGIGVVGTLTGEIQRPLPHPKWLPWGATRLRVGGLVYRREYSGGGGNGIRLVEGVCAIDLLDWRPGRPVISSCWASGGRRVCARRGGRNGSDARAGGSNPCCGGCCRPSCSARPTAAAEAIRHAG